MRYLKRQRGAINVLLVVIVILAIVILGGVAYWIQSRSSTPSGGTGESAQTSSQTTKVELSDLVDKVLGMLPEGDGYVVGYSSGATKLTEKWQQSAAIPEEWKDVVNAAKKLQDKFEKVGAFGISFKFDELKGWVDEHKGEEKPSEEALKDFKGLYFAAVAVMKDGAKLDDIVSIINDEILPAAAKAAVNQPESELKNLNLTMKKSDGGYLMYVQAETKDGESVALDVPVYYQQDDNLLVITFPKPASDMPKGLADDPVFKENWKDVKGNDLGVLAVLKSIPDVEGFNGPVVAKITGKVSDDELNVEIRLNKGIAIDGKALEALKRIPISGGADGALAIDLGIARPVWDMVKQKFADEMQGENVIADRIVSFLSDKALGIYFAYGDKPRLYVGVSNLTVSQLKDFVKQIDPQSAGMLDFVLSNPKDVNGVEVYDLTPLVTSQGVPMVPGESVALMEYDGNIYLGLGVIDEDAKWLTEGSSAVYEKLSSFVSDSKPEVVWYANVPADFKDQLKATIEAVAGTMPQQLQQQLDEMVVVPYEEMGFVDLRGENSTYIHIYHKFTGEH